MFKFSGAPEKVANVTVWHEPVKADNAQAELAEDDLILLCGLVVCRPH